MTALVKSISRAIWFASISSLQPGADGAAPTPEPCFRVIMPPQGFLGAFNSMQQLIDKLVDAGVLRKNENAK